MPLHFFLLHIRTLEFIEEKFTVSFHFWCFDDLPIPCLFRSYIRVGPTDGIL